MSQDNRLHECDITDCNRRPEKFYKIMINASMYFGRCADHALTFRDELYHELSAEEVAVLLVHES